MSNVEEKAIVPYFFKGFRNSRRLNKPGLWFTVLFFLTSLFMIIPIIYFHPASTTHAATPNTAEDNFQRADTTVGWGTTTNTDGLTNYSWQRSLSNTSYAYTHSNTGTIVYAGVNGHQVAGYVGVPAQQGGDALAEITFTAIGHGEGGLCLQVTGGTAWYQGDMNTSLGTLEIRKRRTGTTTTQASVPFAYAANTGYWLRLDIQAGSGSEQVRERIWAAGTAEPSTWQVTWTDNSPLPAGAAGAEGNWFKSPAPGEQVIFQSWSYAATGFAVGNLLSLSTTSGPAGTHVLLNGSGFTPGENYLTYWNYTAANGRPSVQEAAFFFFSSNGVADVNGNVNTSLWTPFDPAGTYVIAVKGLTSGIVETATFQQISSLETGLYIGPPGSQLRLQGLSFQSYEPVIAYWNWTPTNKGTLIVKATADVKGDFVKGTYTIPAQTPNGTYTVAAIGSTSGDIALTKFVVGSPTLNTTPPGPSDWAGYGYDNQGTRVNPTETTITSANVSTLAPKWKIATPILNKIVGSPVIANGVLYIGTVEGTVSAYNITTGANIWTFYAKGPIYGSPTISGGIAYFGSVNFPSEDLIGNFAYALNISDGSVIWENYLAYGASWGSPTVANGLVYFGSAHKEPTSYNSGSGGAYAFNALTGQTVWNFSTLYGIWGFGISLDPTNMNLYMDTGNPCTSMGVPGDGCSGTVLDLNPATGSTIWSYHVPDVSGDDDLPTQPLFSNGNLYVIGKSGIFYSLNAFTGAINWQYNTGTTGDSGGYSSPALYNGMLYFGDGDDYVYALNASDGTLVWRYKTGLPVTASVTVANGIVYATGQDGNVYAFDPGSGALLWSYTASTAGVWGAPVVSNGALYVSTGDGYIYSFTPGGV